MKLNDIYNPPMKWLLRSPLHGLASGSVLLLTFSGRKSGRQFSTPINYARDGDTITVITNRKHVWWRNLQGGAMVKVRVKSEDRCGTAQVVAADETSLLASMRAVYRGIPDTQAARLAPDGVMIRIQLDEAQRAVGSPAAGRGAFA